MLHCDRDCSGANKWRAARQHFEHYNAEGIEIGGCRQGLATSLLRRKIISGTQHNATVGEACILNHTHDTEIGKLDENAASANVTTATEYSRPYGTGAAGQHDVLRPTVTMNKAPCMRNLQYSTYLRRDFQHLVCLQLAALRNQLLQGGTVNILHNQKILAHLLDKVIDGNCIRVCQLSGSTRLSAKAFHSSQIIFVQGAQDFHCHDALYAVIPGLKDAGHTTGGDMFTNLIAPSNQGTVKLVQLLTSSNPGKQSTMIRPDHRGLVYH